MGQYIDTLNTVNGIVQQLTAAEQAKKDAERQQEYQKELAKDQSTYNREAVQDQFEKQKQMYEYTGYESKVRQLKAAGLNPGLIYSNGAGTGGVTGNTSAAQVSQGNAPNMAGFRANQIAAQGMALQLAKLKSEIEVNQSVAKVNEAAAGYKSGAETKLAEQQTLKAGTETELQKIELEIAKATKEDNIDRVVQLSNKAYYEAQKTLGEMKSAMAKGTVDVSSQETIIKQYNENLKNTIADTIVKYSEGKVNTVRLKQILSEIEQNWIHTENDSYLKKTAGDKLRREMFNMTDEYKEDVMQLINNLIPSVFISKKIK